MQKGLCRDLASRKRSLFYVYSLNFFVFQELRKALVSRKNLSEVLKEAEAAGLSSKELEPARAALAMDDEKVKVRRRLQQAISERHLGQLKAALALAERVKLLPEEMRPARDLLKELEAKETQT